MPTIAARLAAKTRQGDGDACHEWQGHCKRAARQPGEPSTLAYGQIWHNGRARRAHVVAYELAHGPVPPGHIVGHDCDNARCVRVDHLRAVTLAQNLRDAWARGRRRRVPEPPCAPEQIAQ